MASPLLLLLCFFFSPSLSLDFLLNSFPPSSLLLLNDSHLSSARLVLTNNSHQWSLGRAFHPSQLPITPNTSVSTSFVFSVLPQNPSSPGFGLAFVLSNTTSPPNALSSQYFGLFSNSTRRSPYPLLAVEFDTGQNPEFGDPDGNHVGIDLNYIESSFTSSAGYHLDSGEFVPVDMRSGRNIRAWIDLDVSNSQICVTIAPVEVTHKPKRPLINFTDPEIVKYLSPRMYVGFSASKTQWIEEQRILAWSLSDTGKPPREIDTTNLPVFQIPKDPSRSPALSPGLVVGVVVAGVILLALFTLFFLWCHMKEKRQRRDLYASKDDMEDWELEFWPRRFSYLDLYNASTGFSSENILGYGGFGKVYKGVLKDGTEIAVKCVSHESKQGLREFMAEISSMGRLQHKSLVPMRGWCRKDHELMLVYDYMPNGSLGRWIFQKESNPSRLLDWTGRKRVLLDVAEGLLYLHEGWEKVVLHRDVKPSNILMDGEMRGRIGDFGLAKLYGHGEVAGSTRVVGTLGYLAPEMARVAAPTKASDVYGYGVVVLEVCSGKRAIEVGESLEEEDFVLVEWVRGLYVEGRVREVGVCGGVVEEEEEEREMVVKLGLACCHPDPELRPTMKEVVGMLVGLESPV